MPSVFTIAGAEGADLGRAKSHEVTHKGHACKCSWNKRTKRWALSCYIGKGSTRTGWRFEKDADAVCGK